MPGSEGATPRRTNSTEIIYKAFTDVAARFTVELSRWKRKTYEYSQSDYLIIFCGFMLFVFLSCSGGYFPGKTEATR